jgi:outer membrane protein assembly factor BamB
MALALVLAAPAWAGDWTFYRHDLAGTANAGEPLTTDQARALYVNRALFAGGDDYSNPIVAGGSLYYTSGDGSVHAVGLADFTERWSKPVSASGPLPPCITTSNPAPVGAPAVVGSSVFVPGGDGYMYSLDAATGSIIQPPTKIADVNNLGEFLWSSAFPLNGKIYVGVSSLNDCLLVPGRLVALDQATGNVVGTWWADANHQSGGGIWTQQAYDPVTNRLFATTGTIAKGKTTAQQPWADAFVAIDPDTMETVDSFSPIPGDNYYEDADFGASPTIYDSPDGGHFIAATNKNGWVYALDRDNLAGGILWKYQISGGGASPDLGESSIVSAPYANGTLFVGGGRTADGKYPGNVAALDAFTGPDASTGAPKWIFHPAGFVLAGMTVTGQVLFVGTADPVTGRGILYALDQADGAVLYQLATAEIFGEPTWANGALYVGDGTGSLFELVPNPLGPQPDFDLTVDRLIASPVAGGSLKLSVSAIAKNGFNAPVALTVTRLNEGATAAFTPTTLSPSGQTPYSSTMALSTAASIGQLYETVVISGTGGGKTRSAAFWLVVGDFSLAATPASAAQGSSATSTVTIAGLNGFADPVALSVSGLPAGTTASFSPATPSFAPGSTSATSTLTFSTSPSTPPGTYTATVTGQSGGASRTCTIALQISQPADFQVAVMPGNVQVARGGQATYQVSIASAGSFPVTLSASGLPPGATASFAPGPNAEVEVLTVSLGNDTPTGLWTFSVMAAGGGLTHTASVLLTVTGPGFDLMAGPPSATIPRGASGTFSITVSPHNGFSGSVHLRADGLPAGASASWSAVDTASSSTLTVSVSTSAQPGTYPISVSGTGTGAIGSAEVSVTIVDPPPSTGGCSSDGPTGFAAALCGVLLATRLLRRRQGAQPCAALESNIVSE